MNLLNLLYFKRNSNISKSAKIYPFSKISNSTISDFSYVSYSCIINVSTIGKFCSIANGVKIGLGIHPTDFISTSPIFYSPTNPLKHTIVSKSCFEENKKVIIGNDVWIGASAIILDGITIGDGAIIAANSVVTKDVSKYSIVGGVPAKEIKKRFSHSIIERLNSLKWWNLPITFFKTKKVIEIFSKKMEEANIHELEKVIKNYKNNL
ncbi:CatB-related O-acetyltransferase [Maribacter sp.]|uniref:CatB-related O-acetyltransferase n=1 Tax=Maribacter sp. TaxID=1897614 RepID=UPI0025B9225C|nr:CatB-related O-acetyltransferase [Maribacter sp.]